MFFSFTFLLIWFLFLWHWRFIAEHRNKGTIFILLFDFQLLINIQSFISSFTSEVTDTILLLDEIYSVLTVNIWLNVYFILVYLLSCWYNTRSYCSNSLPKSGRFKDPSNMTLVLLINRLTKCASKSKAGK